MRPASLPRLALAQRLLHIDPAGPRRDLSFHDLPSLLEPGDLLVVNDAATVPASVPVTARGRSLELRLVGRVDDGAWRGVLFGPGSWRDDTGQRPAPPRLLVGEEVHLGPDLRAVVEAVGPHSARLLTLRFDRAGAPLWEALYRRGRPVQYSYLDDDLPLSAVQTVYAGRPWAVEMPSAGRPLTVSMLSRLRARGVHLATLTHAAGLSSTGDADLDAVLPLPERYAIPAATAAAVNDPSGRIIAVGTSVVRALESAVDASGRVAAGEDETELVIEAHSTLRVVDGLLSGMHEPGESHFRMHCAFASPQVLLDAHAHAVRQGYRNHEFGDSVLVLGSGGQG